MSTCTHPSGTECEHTRALQQWMRFSHGRSHSIIPETPMPCPLCETTHGTHRIHCTDHRVCGDCLGGIPVEMHMPEVTA